MSLVHTHNNGCVWMFFFSFWFIAWWFASLGEIIVSSSAWAAHCNAKVIYLFKMSRIEFTHSLMWFQTCGERATEWERGSSTQSAREHWVQRDMSRYHRIRKFFEVLYTFGLWLDLFFFFVFNFLHRSVWLTIVAARLSRLHFIYHTLFSG